MPTREDTPVPFTRPPPTVKPSLFSLYLTSLQTHPLLTKSITSATLNSLQELLAFHIVNYITAKKSHSHSGEPSRDPEKQKRNDDDDEAKERLNKSKIAFEKAIWMGLYGFFISGPLGHFCYKWLADYFHGRNGLGVALKQLAIANFVISPLHNAGKSFKDVVINMNYIQYELHLIEVAKILSNDECT